MLTFPLSLSGCFWLFPVRNWGITEKKPWTFASPTKLQTPGVLTLLLIRIQPGAIQKFYHLKVALAFTPVKPISTVLPSIHLLLQILGWQLALETISLVSWRKVIALHLVQLFSCWKNENDEYQPLYISDLKLPFETKYDYCLFIPSDMGSF